jgi:hypothetical protein
MGAAVVFDLLAAVCSDPCWDRDPTSHATEEQVSEETGSELSEELGGESVDEGFDPPEDYRECGDERRHYANGVGMSLWEKV